MTERAFLFLAKVARAARYYRQCRFTWRLSWLKAGSGDGFAR